MPDRLSAAFAALTLALLVPLAGCGTIMHGSTQDVSIASQPSGAEIRVNGIQNAETPALLVLERKRSHTLELTLDGYEPHQMQLQRSTSGWVWGNIVFGGLIGLVVDASTGGMYKLTPEQVMAELDRAGRPAEAAAVSAGGDEDRLYLFVTLAPQADWELVGQLEREQD
jgi:hypothetical protein